MLIEYGRALPGLDRQFRNYSKNTLIAAEVGPTGGCKTSIFSAAQPGEAFEPLATIFGPLLADTRSFLYACVKTRSIDEAWRFLSS